MLKCMLQPVTGVSCLIVISLSSIEFHLFPVPASISALFGSHLELEHLQKWTNSTLKYRNTILATTLETSFKQITESDRLDQI
jgi:hypothetical protein